MQQRCGKLCQYLGECYDFRPQPPASPNAEQYLVDRIAPVVRVYKHIRV
jgi:hypothetical protein